jgi:hypothetical protein
MNIVEQGFVDYQLPCNRSSIVLLNHDLIRVFWFHGKDVVLKNIICFCDYLVLKGIPVKKVGRLYLLDNIKDSV